MSILVGLFQAWLVVVAVSGVILLLCAMFMRLGEPPKPRYYNNAKAARIAAKPQRAVLWWLPHDQGVPK